MQEWTQKEFGRVLEKNGYTLQKKRGKGGHAVYRNDEGKHVSIPLVIIGPMAKRLIKENNLNTDV